MAVKVGSLAGGEDGEVGNAERCSLNVVRYSLSVKTASL